MTVTATVTLSRGVEYELSMEVLTQSVVYGVSKKWRSLSKSASAIRE